jgi:hypothetical protein
VVLFHSSNTTVSERAINFNDPRVHRHGIFSRVEDSFLTRCAASLVQSVPPLGVYNKPSLTEPGRAAAELAEPTLSFDQDTSVHSTLDMVPAYNVNDFVHKGSEVRLLVSTRKWMLRESKREWADG